MAARPARSYDYNHNTIVVSVQIKHRLELFDGILLLMPGLRRIKVRDINSYMYNIYMACESFLATRQNTVCTSLTLFPLTFRPYKSYTKFV